VYGQGLIQAPAKCASKPGTGTPIEVSSSWSPILQPVSDQPDALPSSGRMSLTPSAEVKWPGVIQSLSFQRSE
jgi:hypothetical protein